LKLIKAEFSILVILVSYISIHHSEELQREGDQGAWEGGYGVSDDQPHDRRWPF
jgi:hypothetical protein